MSDDVLIIEEPQYEVVEVDGQIEVLEVGGPQGPAGPPGASGSGGVLLEFSWGDASPVLIATAGSGKSVLEVRLSIETPFNGVGAALSVGIVGTPNDLMSTAQSNPAESATFAVYPNKSYGSAQPIHLFITPGAGASAGKAQVQLSIEP